MSLSSFLSGLKPKAPKPPSIEDTFEEDALAEAGVQDDAGVALPPMPSSSPQPQAATAPTAAPTPAPLSSQPALNQPYGAPTAQTSAVYHPGGIYMPPASTGGYGDWNLPDYNPPPSQPGGPYIPPASTQGDQAWELPNEPEPQYPTGNEPPLADGSYPPPPGKEPKPGEETPEEAEFNWERPATLEEAVRLANLHAYGGRNQNNAAYWADMWAKDPEYTWQRMIGNLGGGADVALAGPYAGRDFGSEGYGGGGDQSAGGGGFNPPQLGSNNPYDPGYGSGIGQPGGAAGSGGGWESGNQIWNDEIEQQIRDTLMQQLGLLSQPVDKNDPSIRAVMDATFKTSDIVRQNRRSAEAERLHASGQGATEGGGSGALDQAIVSGYEDQGNLLAGVEAQLFRDEILSRRSSLQALLNSAIAAGDAEAGRDIQMQIAAMDNELQKYGIDVGNAQFYDQLAFNMADREAFWQADAANRLLA
jgi:hypothetical protein